MKRVEFVMRGKNYTLTDDGVNAAMRGQIPGPIREYAVPVNGRWFPVRQVFASSIREPQGLVNTQVAVRQLRRLGYPIHSVKAAGVLPPPPGAADIAGADADPAAASRALELAVEVHKGSGKSGDEILATAQAFLNFLSTPA